MKLTPIDIQQQQFRRTWRGLSPNEVTTFLALVAEQLQELGREHNDVKAELRRVQRELEEHRDREQSLKEAMITAQRAIDDIRQQAQKEAQLVVAEAELRAERLVHNAHSRVTKILEEVADLRRQRVRLIEELRGVLNTHASLLEVHTVAPTEGDAPEASVRVLDRLRAPAPPRAEGGGAA